LLEEYRVYVEQQLLDLTEQAERWAEEGVPPVRKALPPPADARRLAG